jgi:hypothetical protein
MIGQGSSMIFTVRRVVMLKQPCRNHRICRIYVIGSYPCVLQESCRDGHDPAQLNVELRGRGRLTPPARHEAAPIAMRLLGRE